MLLKRKLRDRPEAGAPAGRPGPVQRALGKVTDFFLLTVYWLLTSLPLVTVGASTAALYYVAMKTVRRQEGGLWRMYIRSFRKNLKQGIFLWLLYVFLAVDVWLIAVTAIRTGAAVPEDFRSGGRWFVPLVAGGAVYTVMMTYTFALLASFRQTIRQCLTAAFGLTFGALPSSLLFCAIPAALAALTWYLLPPLVFIDLPLAVYLISLRMVRIFDRQVERAEKARNDT